MFFRIFQDLISKCHRPTKILIPFPAHILNHGMSSGQNRNNGSNEIPCSLHSGSGGDGTNIPVNVDYDYCIFMFQNKDMTLAPILLFSNQPLTLNGSCVISSICILTSSAQACILAHPWDCLAYYLTQ